MGIALQGVITGLVLSIYVGATFFTIIETSIRRGAVAAVILNTGVWVSDMVIIALAYYGAAELMKPWTENQWIQILAGLIFLVFGIAYFFRKPDETIKPLTNNKMGVAILFFKGFAINSLNPGVFVFWFGTMVMVVSSFHLTGLDVLYYFTAVVGTVVLIDLIKVLTAIKLRRVINNLMMSWLFRITGGILMIFGLFLIVKTFA